MSTSSSPGQRLRQSVADSTIQIPGAFNALAARLIEQAGYDAVYLSGAAFSAGTLALPDVGLFTLSELATQTAYIRPQRHDSADRRRRHRLRRGDPRRAHGPRTGSGRGRRHSDRRSAVAQALRPLVGQVARRAGRDVRQASGRRRGPDRSGSRDHRPHRCPRREFARRRDLSGTRPICRRERIGFFPRRWPIATSSRNSPTRSMRRWWPT